VIDEFLEIKKGGWLKGGKKETIHPYINWKE
jgi:hypothetical protein